MTKPLKSTVNKISMKTIIAEKPSVAREIARIVGATEREEGYITGNGYNVTWAFGHLVMPALPDGYGVKGFHRDNLPIIPPVFTLVPRQVRSDNGYKPDSGAVAQIKIISKLFKQSDRIIVATDAGREGELIFRYLYEYIGSAVPFDRLWISSLTDKAIREGLSNLKSGAEYDKLYDAAKARSEADWLVGINATQAITVAAGRGTYSLGRVQTPTLAMVCERYWENRRFVPEDVFQLHLATNGKSEGEIVKLSSSEKWKDKQIAEEAYQRVKVCETFRITAVERKESVQEAPLLYDLTTLQKEANTKHGFSAEQTLSIAQRLYEAKLITYPRTGSRYISEDVFAEIPKLLRTLKNDTTWGNYVTTMGKPTRRSVDDTKITDHHALLITGVQPKVMEADDHLIYHMIIGRMLESFSDKCIKDVTTVSAKCDGIPFAVKGAVIKQSGWRGVYQEKDESEDVTLPNWSEGDTLPVKGCSLTEGKTKPKPLHTEASLLSAMRIADVTMTGEWELALSNIESGEMRAETFRSGIEVYASQITSELLSCDKIFAHKESNVICPKCKTGVMQFYNKVVKCSNPDCELPVFRQKAGKTLADLDILDLLTRGETGIIKGFKSKQGKAFSAAVAFDGDFNTVFVFPETKNTPKNKPKRK